MLKDNIIERYTNFLITLPIIWIFTGLFILDNGDKILVILTLLSTVISLLIYKTSVCKKKHKDPVSMVHIRTTLY
ncbi:hypothetical protein UA40_09585 [Photobacterium kishitanii]|nr:hypothetical protein UA40_09585 [Photobacterium kishitanii]